MKSVVKAQGRRVLAPVAVFLANIGVSPDHLTLAGLLGSTLAGVLVADGRFLWAAAALLAGSLCDVLDGSVARFSNRSSRFGAFLDSTVDRYAEMVFFAGVLVYFVRGEGDTLYALLTFLAAGGSFMVSYTRARAEGIGIPCEVGMMERPERMVVLLIATLVGPMGLRIALWVLTVLVTWTSLQRVMHVRRETRS